MVKERCAPIPNIPVLSLKHPRPDCVPKRREPAAAAPPAAAAAVGPEPEVQEAAPERQETPTTCAEQARL